MVAEFNVYCSKIQQHLFFMKFCEICAYKNKNNSYEFVLYYYVCSLQEYTFFYLLLDFSQNNYIHDGLID